MSDVRDNPERSRYELDVDGQIVFARYARRGDDLAILHVEAPPALRGKGHADKLMQGLMEHARRQRLQVIPYCGYAASWMRRHLSV